MRISRFIESIWYSQSSPTFTVFDNYIINRYQRVRVDGTLSGSEPVLESLLWSIYLNGLFFLQSTGKIIGFADDIPSFTRDMCMIKKWFDFKLLTINFEKTNCVPFSCDIRNMPSFHQLHLNPSSDFYCFSRYRNKILIIRIIIDSQLRWISHINDIAK